MSQSDKPICIIPARGGSKRFPRKNVAPLGGKPLLAWTIETAISSAISESVVVSSDDAEILNVAKNHGATIHERAATLSDDRTTVAEVCTAICGDITGERIDDQTIIALLPTSPFRSAKTIRGAYEQFVNNNGESMLSVSPLEHPPEWAMMLNEGFLQPCDEESYNTPRNELQPSVRGDGLIMMARLSFLKAHRSFLGPRTLAFLSPPGETVDIDEPRDLLWAEFLLAQQEK
ncbi:MAG: hypothetical protein DHS20C16_25830 [Phycisphaerae bacterium]|nr:MAG: hypothetical protein DHS20C16_25830 [Phycisphaerae bacterium]